jgi:hypothetical protein
MLIFVCEGLKNVFTFGGRLLQSRIEWVGYEIKITRIEGGFQKDCGSCFADTGVPA